METAPYEPACPFLKYHGLPARAVSDKLRFRCEFCGMDFGEDVIGLAKHIGRSHDPPRG